MAWLVGHARTLALTCFQAKDFVFFFLAHGMAWLGKAWYGMVWRAWYGEQGKALSGGRWAWWLTANFAIN